MRMGADGPIGRGEGRGKPAAALASNQPNQPDEPALLPHPSAPMLAQIDLNASPACSQPPRPAIERGGGGVVLRAPLPSPCAGLAVSRRAFKPHEQRHQGRIVR
ncbi:uncharacterized protein BDZ99DRAFT_527914 [Mytilinidion resinicola]|uniref:Uncharacterized protein n=1 Tax=Mytilinidion resinicola TaxID=574789 RepID=A0A6A6Y149_9PEZI|nr:uncharacterized protein BDZ99DRAFT_527914 [Mytilinidion resinicola]KAF2801955.1 hypothetical protein BDZ99DRAFT_527914 [Mytilinidion resinicola]